MLNKAEYNKEFEEENTTTITAESDANKTFLKEDFNSKLSKSETISFDSDKFRDTKFPANLSLDTIPCSNNN